jgi:predicted ATP-dependent endonuclease of OLD family
MQQSSKKEFAHHACDTVLRPYRPSSPRHAHSLFPSSGVIVFLIRVRVGPFKSVDDPQDVRIESSVTVLVGMNEAGKTVFLQALQKSDDALKEAKFDPIDDYPRKDFTKYMRSEHKVNPAAATKLTYQLRSDEISELNATFYTKLAKDFQFSVTHNYANGKTIEIEVDEKPVLAHLLAQSDLSSGAKSALKKISGLREAVTSLEKIALTDDDKTFVAALAKRVARTKWSSVVQFEIWSWLAERLPKFAYFSDYEILPSKINLANLALRVQQADQNGAALKPDQRAVLALLRMADISLTDFTKPGGYEELKAKIEAVSISLTDQIMEFWKQNENLEVEIDIKPDPEDEAPFNSGPNLYLRIKNRKHRGVSTPFAQRSRGFIWFFSFLVWFDSVQDQLAGDEETPSPPVILLLDEPALSLHALAQSDFLRYIDDLAKRHQVLYTTHSPFMVHSDRLNQVRVVEDRDKMGTEITEDLNGSDPRTIFPLQAALGWSIAQNLFISKRNLLVEGPSELLYLQQFSSFLELAGRTGLRSDVTIVPVGGLDKVSTFVALLGASGLDLAVLHDFRGSPDQKLGEMIKAKLIPNNAVLNVSQFRDLKKIGINGAASDLEDLLLIDLYLQYFNQTFEKVLPKVVVQGDLPAGSRVVDRLDRYLNANDILTRPSGGFNHFSVASTFIRNPPENVDADTLMRFENLFKAVNALF